MTMQTWNTRSFEPGPLPIRVPQPFDPDRIAFGRCCNCNRILQLDVSAACECGWSYTVEAGGRVFAVDPDTDRTFEVGM